MKLILRSSDGFGSMTLTTKSGANVNHECLITTKGFCFICIRNLEGTPPLPPQSLDWLESHLDITVHNWLAANGFLTGLIEHPFLLQLNEKGVNYQVNLCSDCASTVGGLSAVPWRDKPTVISTLRAIQIKMEESDKSDNMAEFYKQTGTRANPDQALTSIGRGLRKEIIDRCSSQVQHLEKQLGTVTVAQPGNDSDEVAQGTLATAGKASAQVIQPEGNHFQQQQLNENVTASAMGSRNDNCDHPVGPQPTSSEQSGLSEPEPGLSGLLPVIDEDDMTDVMGTREFKRLKSKSTPSQSPQDALGVIVSEPAPSTSASVIRRSTRNSAPNTKSVAGRPSRLHMETHLDMEERARPYQCEICKMSFLTNSHLVEHKMVHVKGGN